MHILRWIYDTRQLRNHWIWCHIHTLHTTSSSSLKELACLFVRHLLVQKTALAEHFNDSDLKAFLHEARSQGAHCRLPVVSIFHKFDSKGQMTKRSKTTNAFTQSLCSTANRWHLLCGNLMMGFDLMCHTPLMDLSKMPLVKCSVAQVSVKSYHRYIKVSHTHNIWTFFSNVVMGFIGMEFGWLTYDWWLIK